MWRSKGTDILPNNSFLNNQQSWWRATLQKDKPGSTWDQPAETSIQPLGLSDGDKKLNSLKVNLG